MAAKKRTIGKRKLSTPRAIGQQRSRRRDSMFRKAFEYCCECDADIFLMIRLKHNGQTFIFNSDSNWPVVQEDVFLQYPTPKTITELWGILART
ncbi:hypothetical protein BDV29DRAFT_181055 [Aspergillus leporis]|uniref:MADS-box domain-containing protein n=1 Tax=Aspergillus leporis TaxID=41062 RepID=A0A5N5WP93_9EURO|nr:hypothetical protein BDV29DRAFT_181055 [Aspergillus leporis]